MKTSQMKSLVDAVRTSVEGEDLQEKIMVLKGLNAFKNDESMIDDLENDLQGIGLKPGKGYKLDLKKGTVSIMKSSPKLKNIQRIYRLKEEAEVVEEQKQLDENVSLMIKSALNDVMNSSRKIENTFEELTTELSASMKELLSEFMAKYFEKHVFHPEDIGDILEYMRENPDAVEKAIEDTINFRGFSGMVNLAKVIREVGPDLAKTVIEEIQRDTKFVRYMVDKSNEKERGPTLGSSVSDFVRGLFK